MGAGGGRVGREKIKRRIATQRVQFQLFCCFCGSSKKAQDVCAGNAVEGIPAHENCCGWDPCNCRAGKAMLKLKCEGVRVSKAILGAGLYSQGVASPLRSSAMEPMLALDTHKAVSVLGSSEDVRRIGRTRQQQM